MYTRHHLSYRERFVHHLPPQEIEKKATLVYKWQPRVFRVYISVILMYFPCPAFVEGQTIRPGEQSTSSAIIKKNNILSQRDSVLSKAKVKSFGPKRRLQKEIKRFQPMVIKHQLDSMLREADSLLQYLKSYASNSSEMILDDSVMVKQYLKQFSKDSFNNGKDSLKQKMESYAMMERKRITNDLLKMKGDTGKLNAWKKMLSTDTLLTQLTDPFKTLSFHRPWVKLNGGFVTYDFNYRSNIDTPFIEKDLSQHQLLLGANVVVGELIPLRVNALFRRSNSGYFNNINDVQVVFDPAAFRQRFNSLSVQHVLYEVQHKKDSLLKQLTSWKELPYGNIEKLFRQYFSPQKYLEANEVYRIPRKAYNMSLPDSVNVKNAANAQQKAKQYMDTYNAVTEKYSRVKHFLDSVKGKIEEGLSSCKRYERMIKDYLSGKASLEQVSRLVSRTTDFDMQVPRKYQWLMNIRTAALGRTNVSTSELTTKNISLTGIHFEYNSWYYLAVSAGLVDYRFRDFVMTSDRKTPQYLYQLRLGVGRLESNYFILTGYQGKKQLFTSSSGLSSIKVTGMSAEAKWQVSRNVYVIGEVAQSISPNFNANPPVKNSGWNWSDNTNKAYAVRGYSFLPRTGTRIEGMYKYAGANFQSFNSFQTNSTAVSWYVRGDQSFFKRSLRVSASIRANDFSNPYILQRYKANTIFKSITASYHKRGWPHLTIGYMPMSQLTMVDSQVAESRFQTLNASLNHFYSISGQRQATSLVYTKFYNNSTDTGFVYFNAVNFFLGHTIFFRRFTGTINVTHSKSLNYQYNVMEENINIPFSSRGSLGAGVKIHNLDLQVTKIGGLLNGNYRFKNGDVLFLYLEQGYLPGSQHQLVQNLMGNINFTKTF